MLITPPRPRVVSSMIAVMVLSSHARPTSFDSVRGVGWCSPAAISRRAATGVPAPLMLTSSGVPRSTTFSTSRAVDSLSITPPAGAIDSIRCAMPT